MRFSFDNLEKVQRTEENYLNSQIHTFVNKILNYHMKAKTKKNKLVIKTDIEF